jgi:spore germination cell wall hydrolase CwlJ-like protein
MLTERDEDLYWLACTVLMEAGGESTEGKLGVAWSIMNRHYKTGHRPMKLVLAPWQYSCWNTTSPTRTLLVTCTPAQREACHEAALAAFEQTEPDPTHGSTHYLNPTVLPKLPNWYERSLVRAVIGKHHFLVPREG